MVNINTSKVAVLSRCACVAAISSALFIGTSPVAHAAPVGVVTDATFQSQVLDNPNPVLVAFTKPTCVDCQQFRPVLDDIAAENNIQIVTLDVVNNPNTQATYQVETPPCPNCGPFVSPVVIVFQNGAPAKKIKTKNASNQLLTKDQLLQELQAFLAPAAPAPAGPASQFSTATVTGDVDIYDVPGGVGNVIGMLEGGDGQQVQAKCRDDQWCEVSGQGWVWGEFLQF